MDDYTTSTTTIFPRFAVVVWLSVARKVIARKWNMMNFLYLHLELKPCSSTATQKRIKRTLFIRGVFSKRKETGAQITWKLMGPNSEEVGNPSPRPEAFMCRMCKPKRENRSIDLVLSQSEENEKNLQKPIDYFKGEHKGVIAPPIKRSTSIAHSPEA